MAKREGERHDERDERLLKVCRTITQRSDSHEMRVLHLSHLLAEVARLLRDSGDGSVATPIATLTTEVSPGDVVGLNFGGERTIMVKRAILLQFKGSRLARMFDGSGDKLDHDKDGNVFFDYSPSVMMPLIEYLRLYRDLPSGAAVPVPPIPPRDLRAWNAMVEHMGLGGRLAVTAPGIENEKSEITTFTGIRTDVKASDLKGWTLLFSKPAVDKITVQDFVVPLHLDGTALLLGARRPGADTLIVAAMGDASVITHQTEDKSTRFHNGVYWYCSKNRSIGFAPDRLGIGSHDFYDAHEGELRLSWPFVEYGKAGCRAGANTQVQYKLEKLLFISQASF